MSLKQAITFLAQPNSYPNPIWLAKPHYAVLHWPQCTWVQDSIEPVWGFPVNWQPLCNQTTHLSVCQGWLSVPQWWPVNSPILSPIPNIKLIPPTIVQYLGKTQQCLPRLDAYFPDNHYPYYGTQDPEYKNTCLGLKHVLYISSSIQPSF